MTALHLTPTAKPDQSRFARDPDPAPSGRVIPPLTDLLEPADLDRLRELRRDLYRVGVVLVPRLALGARGVAR